MANWRKQQGESHHQVGHWRSSSYNGKPPLDKWQSSVPSWEKNFCASVGSVPWRKLLECKRYMYLHDNVLNWDDSACKEAFDNAKKRFWAEINGLPCNISLPDPDIHIDDVDWNSSADPELFQDLEKEPKVPSSTGTADEDGVILNSTLLLNQEFTATGWGDEEEEVAAETPKPSEQPFSAAQDNWESNNNLNESEGFDSWEQQYYDAALAAEHARAYEWQNIQNHSWGWNQRDQHYYGGGWNGNWGPTCGDGYYYRKRENMASWSKKTASPATATTVAYYHHGGNNEYQMNNRGKRNNRGGRRRGNFGNERSSYMMDKVPTTSPTAW